MSSKRRIVLVLLLAGVAVGGIVLATASPPGTEPVDTSGEPGVETFGSAGEFAAYIDAANREYGDGGRIGFDGQVVFSTATAESESVAVEDTSVAKQVRHSSTNVQELGIGEPDLVKTDGTVAYFSPYGTSRYSPKHRQQGVHALSVQPPGNVSEIGAIRDSGRLLRANDTLVVLGTDAVTGYDVSDPSAPQQVWNRSLDGHISDARLLDGEIYLVIASGIDRQPCPVEPLEGVSTPCTKVLHPTQLVPTDTTYTVTRLDAKTGEPSASRSIIGSRNSVVYMSEDSLYLTMTRSTPRGELMLDFLLEAAAADLPDRHVEHLERLRTYNLSDRAVYAETQHVLNTWLQSMDEAERERTQQRLQNRYKDYTRERLREFASTQIVELDTENLSVAATGEVPGEPLNQWALDEHNDTLRIATTIRAPRLRWQPANSSNDVYTLDSVLDVAGSVQDMSEGQEVFGVRFVGDTGYVITFRQVDPLHVLDLEDPQNPAETGELKLPGFSRYLHPLSEDRLLGVGEEDGQVKTVIFDVSDPTDPTIEHSRVLSARWSAAVENHHAFLQDERHGVFYIPTEIGGQVIASDDLSTVHRVSVNDPRRAIYVGDHLYVFGQSAVLVVDEESWERVDSLRYTAPQK